jgi:thioredoxin reductase
MIAHEPSRDKRQTDGVAPGVPGVFVAGDVRHGSIKRVAAAVGEGATAVALVHPYLVEHSPPET